MKYFIETYGCQMSVHDGERLSGLLESNGYERTESAADADLVVINTCSVRERAEEKLYTRLGEIKEMGRELGRDPIVAVTGCVAQQEGRNLIARSAGVVDVVVGRHSWQREIIETAEPTSIGELTVRVVRTAGLVLLKLHAGGPKDAWDIRALLEATDGAALVRDEVEQALDRLPPDARRLWARLHVE